MSKEKQNKTNTYLELRDDLFCRFCGRSCKNLNSLKQHEIRCTENPDSSKVYVSFRDPEWSKRYCYSKSDGYQPWNKGLTKDTDIRMKKMSENLQELSRNGSLNPYGGYAGTPEKELLRRQKISQSMKLNPDSGGLRHGSGRGHKGWYKGFFCDSTYELVYIIYNLDHNIEFSRCPKSINYQYSFNGKLHRYYPDFILPDGSLVEVKGYKSSLVDAKINSVNDRNITVLYENDLQYAFNYVKETYKFITIEDLYDNEDPSMQDDIERPQSSS